MCGVCPSWLSFILYNPLRKALTDRAKVLAESGVAPDSVVLEVGAGNGFLTEALATAAAKVISVELQEDMVRKLLRRVGRFGDRVEILPGDAAALDMGEEVADVCLLFYSFHEISGQAEAAKRIGRAVKKHGLLAIYEPALEVKAEDMRKTVTIFEDTGFTKEKERTGTFTRFALLRKA